MNSRNLLLQILMLDAGIVPDVGNESNRPQTDPRGLGLIGTVHKPKTLDDLFASLPQNEKKVLQRRFRKLWRKACRRYGMDPRAIRSRAERRFVVKKMLLEDSDSK